MLQTALDAFAWSSAALATGAFALTAFNAFTWPRGRAVATDAPRVSVLIPARNEERTIRRTVLAALAAAGPVDEVVVCDDGSTDRTPAILEELCALDDRLRVVRGIGLPEGWVGKPHACHRLALHASGELLLFVDADTRLHEHGVQRVLALHRELQADVVTAVPRQETGTLAEAMILPLLHLTYVSWLPMPLVWRTRDPRFLAANGQVLAVTRSTYDAIGGFEAVRDEVVDDMAFCRNAKQRGHRVVFADGHHIASCRMYQGADEVWRGFSKNLYEGIGEHPLALAGVVLLFTASFIAPWVLAPWGLATNASWLVPAMIGLGANIGQRILLAIRHGHPWQGVLLHPVAVAGLMAIAVNSWRWSRRDAVAWSGRVYASRRTRKGSPPAPSSPTPAEARS